MYRFNLPTEIIFGIDSLDLLKKEVDALGADPMLLVTGRKAMRLVGVLGRIENALSEGEMILFDRVYPEPDSELIDEGVNLARAKNCELVIGLGGGSVLDTAKAIAGLAGEEDFSTVADYLEGEGTRKLSSSGIPFLAVPTTAGTGSEVTMNSVIINRRTKTKRSFRSPFLFPRTAIIDPRLTLTLPPAVTAASGMDALTHLIEGYVSAGANYMSDILALEGIGLVAGSLVRAVESGDDLDAREKMCQASFLGGILITNAGLGIVHGISSFLGAISGVGHGIACGILLPYAMEFNLPSCRNKYGRIAEHLGKKTAEMNTDRAAAAVIEAVREMGVKTGIPEKLRSVGVKKEDLPVLARKSLTSNSTRKNPRQVSCEDILGILESAF